MAKTSTPISKKDAEAAAAGNHQPTQNGSQNGASKSDAEITEAAIQEQAEKNAGELVVNPPPAAPEAAPDAQSDAQEEAAANAPTPAPISEDDPALLAAWKCLLDYDRVSTQQKNAYLSIRRSAILLSVAVTAAAVLTGLGLQIRLGFTILMIVLVPVFGFLLSNYDTLFGKPIKLYYTRLWIVVMTVAVGIVALVGTAVEWGTGGLIWAAALGLPIIFWLGSNFGKRRFIQWQAARSAKTDDATSKSAETSAKPVDLASSSYDASAKTKEATAPNKSTTRPKFKLAVVLYWLILMGLLTIILAVSAAVNNYQGDVLGGILRVALIVIPIISVAMLNYASEYARNTAWVEYRVGAEEIRSQIYLYRTGSGQYKDPQTRQEKLLDAVENTYTRISNSDFVPFMRSRNNEVLKHEIRNQCSTSPGTSDNDTGLGVLTVEQYLNWRVIKQIEWYAGRIEKDYVLKRRATVGALVLAGMGSALVALVEPFGPVVALTTACGIALTLWNNAGTIGATYGIFQKAASRLEIRVNRWKTLPPAKQQNPQKRSAVVEGMEKVFGDEREEWQAAVRQMLQSVDKALKDLQDGDTDDDDNNPNPKKPPEPPVDEVADAEAEAPTDEELAGEAAAVKPKIVPPGQKE